MTIRNLGLSIDTARITAARFRLQGEGVSAWARRHNFSVKLTHEVLSGRRPCQRGQSHNIAIALGLKDSPTC